MLRIYSIAQKNILLRFSDRSFLIFYLLLPIIFTFVLSSALGGAGQTARPLLLTLEEDTVLTQELQAALAAEPTVALMLLPRPEAEQLWADEDQGEGAWVWLIVPAGTTTAVTQGRPAILPLHKLPNNSDADALERTVTAVVSRASLPLTIAYHAGRATTLAQPSAQATPDFQRNLQLATLLVNQQPDRLHIGYPPTASEQSQQASNTAQQAAGQLVTWVFITLLGASVLFVMERQEGTLRRLLTTPTSKATFFLGMMSGELLLGLVQMGILIGVGALFLGVSWGNDPLALWALLIAFALASVSLGTFLGIMSKTEGQARNLSIMIGMTLALLGGCWWPMELFPDSLRTLALLFPTTWAMDGLMTLLGQQGGLAEVGLNTAVLLLFALLFALLGTWRIRFE
jgi:ABC-2 type transport system permease protein